MRNCDKLARGALDLLRQGWCQHVSARERNDMPCDYDSPLAAAWDLEGACRRAADALKGVSADGREAALAQVLEAVHDELARRHAEGVDRYGGANDRAKVCMAVWNDTPGRKPGDACAVMQRASEALAAKVRA